MAVGRITGPLLASNLLRDGINLSVETDLLYLDVQTGRIGVKTSSPQYDLDVNGTLNTTVLRATSTSTLGLITITKTASSGTIGSTLGPIHIAPAAGESLYIDTNVEVGGNLHATGNISADGNIRLGDTTGTDTLKVGAEIISDLIPKYPNQFNIGSGTNNWLDGYFSQVQAGNLKIGGSTITNYLPGPIDITPNGGVLNVHGNIRVWGNTPLGTAPVTNLVLYVNENGSDTNDGGAMDPSRACRTISAAIRSPLYKEGCSIKVAPGHYLENNPILLKPYTSVIGSDLRTTIIEPINKTQDLFHVQSGCYVAQLMMYNGRSGRFPGAGYTAGTNRGAYATAFPPQVGGEKIDVFHSPYIQNCTNQSGPWLNDGTMFVPNQTVQVPDAVGFATYSANTQTITVRLISGEVYPGQSINEGPPRIGFFNARSLLLANKPFIQEQVVAYVDDQFGGPFQYNSTKCARDTGLLVDSLGLDLIYGGTSQSVFTGLQYWAQSGYTGEIGREVTTTTNAFNYINSIAQLVVRGLNVSSPFQGTLTQVTNLPAGAVGDSTRVSTLFTTATNIISQGTVGITDKIIPNGTTVTANTSTQAAAALLQANKEFLKAETIAWITANAPGSFVYDKAKCKRDTGYLIDCVTFDLLRGGNRQVIQAGVCYYGWSRTTTQIPNEQPQTIMAYDYMKSVIKAVIQSQELTSFYQSEITQTLDAVNPGSLAAATAIGDNIDIITRLIRVGPDGAPALVPIGLTETTTPGLLNAYALLNANKSFIKAEVIAYVNTMPNFVYNKDLCFRDVGIILENVSYDALNGGNWKAVEAGLSYYRGVTSVIKGQETETSAAINYIKTLASNVIRNQTAPNLKGTQAKYEQVINYSLTGAAVAETALSNGFDTIINIINNGPASAPTSYEGCAVDPHYMSAEILLQANRKFIQDEIITYTNQQFLTFPFNSAKCRRDSGLIVDSIAFDLLYPTSGDSQSNFTGLQYWDQGSYTGLIASEITTTTNAVSYLSSLAQKVILNDTSAPRYQLAVSQNTAVASSDAETATAIGTNFELILDILNNGTVGVTDKIVPNGTASGNPLIVHAYQALQNNRAYLRAEVVAFVEATKTAGFVYDQTLCSRDVGYMVDSICFDLLHGGNRQSIQSAVYYYTFNGSSTAIQNEITETVAAYNHMSDIVAKIIRGTPIARSKSNKKTQIINLPPASATEVSALQSKISKITNIITNGPSVATSKIPIGLVKSTDENVQRAFDLLEANREFIAEEVVSYVNDTYNDSGFSYNKVKCARDTGIIVDSIVTDLGWHNNGYTQTNFAGLQYYNQSGYTGVIQSELTTTTSAINYLKTIAKKSVLLDLTGVRYQSTVTQVINLPTASTAERDRLEDEFTIVTDILTNGTTNVTDLVDPNGIIPVSDFATKAFDLLQANKAYLQAEVIAFIEATKTSGFEYDREVCKRDTGLIIDSITQDLYFSGTSQSIFAGIQYFNQSGYIGLIGTEINTTTNAINYVSALAQKLIFNDTTGTRRQTNIKQVTTLPAATTAEADRIAEEFIIITDILGTGVAGVTDRIISNDRTPSILDSVNNAYVILQANKDYLKAEAVAFVEATKTPGFVYNQTTCARDVGYMVDAVSFDLLWGGNRQAIQSGVYYYSYNGASSAIPNESTEVLAAYAHLRTLIGQLCLNTTVSAYQTAVTQVKNLPVATASEIATLQANIDIITNIITNGPSVVTTKSPIGLTANNATGILNALDIMDANKEFIKAELIAYIDHEFGGFRYDQAKCTRDVGYMIDSISYDIKYGGNRQAIISGVYYYGFSGATAIPNEQPQTTAAYERMREIMDSIVKNIPVQPTPGNNTAQEFTGTSSTGETADMIEAMIDNIITIISEGPNSSSVARVPIGLTQDTSTNIARAQELLLLNKNFIVDEITSFVDYTFKSGGNFTYNQEKCYRDVGLIVDAISQDVINGGNTKTIEAALTYWTGGVNVVYNEVPQNLAAYAYMKTLMTKIVQNQTVTSLSSSPQTINTYFDGGYYAVSSIERLIDILGKIVSKGPSVAPETYEGTGAFAKVSSSYDDVLPASTVLSVTDNGDGTYDVYLSKPTQGPLYNGTIYFGQTTTYPLQDKNIPAQWAQRKLDPFGSIGGSLVDGAVTSDRSPVHSFVYDAFTQVNQGGIGIHITNNGYAQLVSVFTIFCGTSVLVENGGICSITNSNANFGDYCLVSKGYGKLDFFGEVINPPLLPYYPNGFFPQQQQVEIYCPNPDDRPHIGQVMEVIPPDSYINSQGLPGFLSAAINTSTLTTGSVTVSGIDNTGIVIGQEVYARDQYGSYTDINGNRYLAEGTTVNDVSFKTITLSDSIQVGGGALDNPTYFTLYFTGNAYYTIRGSVSAPDRQTPGTAFLSSVSTAQGNNQVPQEIQALQYLNTLTNQIISNTLISALQSTATQVTNITLPTGYQSTVKVKQLFTVLENVIQNGLTALPKVTKTGIVAPGASDASALLLANKSFLQAEIIEYINSQYFVYDHATCRRDLGYILDGFGWDVLTGSNYQSIKCGNAYLRAASGAVLEKEKPQTADAIAKVAALTNQLSGISTVTSAISSINLGGIAIQNFINGGTPQSGPAYSLPVPGTLDLGKAHAKSLIETNITWIKEELIGYINATYPVYTYDATLCKRDIGFVIDGIEWDLLLGTNYRSVKSGQAYFRGSANPVLDNEKPETVAAFNFVRDYLLELSAVSVSTTATQVVRDHMAIVNTILQNGNLLTHGVNASPTVTYTLPTNIVQGYDSASLLLQANKAFIQAEVEAYVYTTFTSGGFVYDRARCKRDVGLIMDALIYDVTYGGNSMSVDAAVNYYDNSNNNVSRIPNETTQTVAAINYINTIAQRIIKNLAPVVSYQTVNIVAQYTNNGYTNGDVAGTDFADLISDMANIVGNGLNATPVITEPNTSWVTASIVAARNAIESSKNTAASEAISFINDTYTLFTYDQTTCKRDAEYVIYSLLYDLTYGGNWQTVDAGLQYWKGTKSLIPNEIEQTVGAWNYMLYLMQKAASNTAPATSYQGTYTQYTDFGLTNGSNADATLTALMAIVINIVRNGTTVAPTIEYPSTSGYSATLLNVKNIIEAQKTSLITQTLTYIDNKYNGFEYNQTLCKRDVGYVVDAIANDLLTGGNFNITLSAQSYYAVAGTHHYVELEDNVADATLFPDKSQVNFYNRSYMSASGYLFEYVGAGSNYGALPFVGRADPVQEREVIQLNNGKVFFTSTDQNGDFRIGPGLVISQATGVLSGRTFTKSLFANLTPFILAIEGL